MSTETARDELAVDIMEAYFAANDGSGSRHWGHMANTLRSAGYRKPRIVNTIEELATLNRGDVLASGYWADAFSYIGGEGGPTELANVATGERVTIGEDSDFFPATVVYAFEWATA